jgi:hypothetical protein
MVEPRAPFLPVLASHQTYSFNLYIETVGGTQCWWMLALLLKY